MNALRGARERAREEITAAIKDEARRQLAAEGAARLSLRAVARELGMVSSALYRYFPSRDELLTALIIDAYDALGEAAEAALAGAHRLPPRERWLAVCRAVRHWALAHPHEYALLYGSPVPGYEAPQDTIAPASRVGLALVTVAREAHAEGLLSAPPGGPLPERLHDDITRLAAEIGPELPEETVAALAAVWSQFFGLVSFEVFGHYTNMVQAQEEFFGHACLALAGQAGL